MGRRTDHSGRRYGNLIVLNVSKAGSNGVHATWLCKCDCGNLTEVLSHHLKKTKSCGCLVKKHGMYGTNTYGSWDAMIQRCHNSKNNRYKSYGARGIEVCAEWRNSFKQFLKDMGECPKGMSIDRKDNAKGYCPDNCRWATNIEQQNNKRNNLNVKYKGSTKTAAQWAKLYGLSSSVVAQRIRAGWEVEKALTTKVRKKRG